MIYVSCKTISSGTKRPRRSPVSDLSFVARRAVRPGSALREALAWAPSSRLGSGKWNPVRVDKIGKARELALKRQIHGAGRAMSLLADDDFGLAPRCRKLNFPFHVSIGAGRRLSILQIIFFAIDKEYDVGVLFNRPGLAEVR